MRWGSIKSYTRPFWGFTSHLTHRDEFFKAITCTGTDNSKQTGENTPKQKKKTRNKQAVSIGKNKKIFKTVANLGL